MLDTLIRRKTEEKDDGDALAKVEVVKVVEVIGISPKGFEDAVQTAVARAARSLRHISGADVKHMTVAVKDGKVVQYRVDLKVAFALDEEDD